MLAVPVKVLHSRSFRNRQSILESQDCGCFHCLAIFPASQVERFVDREETALCPRCGIDAVLAEASVEGPLRHVLRFMQRACF